MAKETVDVELEEKAAPVENDKTFIEYAGDEKYGTAFLTSHTIPKGDGLWERNGVTMTKDITWTRDPSVGIGQKGAKMRVLESDLPADAVKVLLETPGFKRTA